jgi:hypothetical protein
MNTPRLFVAAFLAWSLIAAKAEAVDRRSGPHITRMEVVNGRPVVEARLNGHGPYRFVFDTGAGVCVLTPDLAREVGAKFTEKSRIGDPSAPDAVEVDRGTIGIEIAGEKFDGVEAVIWDQKSIMSALGDVRGVLGLDCMPNRVVTLDYAKNELRLSRGPLKKGRGVFECRNDRGIVSVDLSIGGETIPAHLDSGKPGDFSVPSRLKGKLKLKGAPVRAQARTASGAFEMEIATLDGTAHIGPCEVVDPELQMTDRFSHGVIGSRALSRFVVSIDLAGERVKLVPIKEWAPPASEKRRYGMMMAMGDGPVTLTGVIPGSVAERAGLQAGDILMKVNGKDFESMDLGERGKVMQMSPIAVVVGRDGKEIELTLKFDGDPGDAKEGDGREGAAWDERAGIERAILDYANGWYDGDTGRMRRALHPDLAKRIMKEDGAAVSHMTADQLIAITNKRAGKKTPKSERVAKISHVDMLGSAAMAKLEMKDWVDYLHLVKTRDGWKIVNVLWEHSPEARKARASRRSKP